MSSSYFLSFMISDEISVVNVEDLLLMLPRPQRGERQPAKLLCPGFSRQEYWSGLPYLPLGDLPTPGIELASPALQAVFTAEPLGKYPV